MMMFARPEDLPEMPEGLRQYIEDWFKPCEMFGRSMLYASARLHLDHGDYSYRGRQPGFAPSHSVDIGSYKIDLHAKATARWLCVLYWPEPRHQNVIDCG